MATTVTVTTTTATTLQALCRANLGILQQKLQLMNIMKTKFGISKAKMLYAQPCPIVQASVGQHIRHSMDHLELATKVAAEATITKTTAKAKTNSKSVETAIRNETSNNNNNTTTDTATDTDTNAIPELHYDLRQRGGNDEYDIEAAQERIERAMKHLLMILEEESSSSSLSSSESIITLDNDNNQNHRHPQNDNDNNGNVVRAYFMLSGDPQEFILPSTIEREMGFAAHHAIHHMAMVKIIAQQTLDIDSNDLPADFGKAPSTIVYDNTTTSSMEKSGSSSNPQGP